MDTAYVLPADLELCAIREAGGEAAFSLYPEFPVPGGGARGGPGSADAALGRFLPDQQQQQHVPQVLCEFKGIRNA